MKLSRSASILFTGAATLALGLVPVGPLAAQAAHAATAPPPQVTLTAPPSGPAKAPVNDLPDPKPLSAAVTPAIVAPLPTGTWSPLGPAPIGPPYLQSGGFYGGANAGRVLGTAVLTNGSHPGRVVIGTAGGGIWTSDDNGTTWTPRTDGLAIPSLAIGDVAAAPSNSDILVAGTGEEAPCGDCFTGAGMLVSTNGGDTWTLQNPGGMFTNVRTSQVAFDPSNPDHVFVATTAGLYITTDLSTWVLPSDPGYNLNVAGNVTSVVVDPTSPLNVYVGDVRTGVAKSTDGGLSWATANIGIDVPLPGSFPNEKLAIANSTPTILYLSIGNTSGVTVYRTTNAGITWVPLSAPQFAGQAYAYGSGTDQQGWYDNIIKVDPNNDSHIVAGGITVVESVDGGVTWNNVNGQTFFGHGTNKFHPDQHALAFRPDGKLWLGNDGGLFLYNNPGQPTPSSITNANGNLNITQFYYGFNEVSGQILAGAQDNGSARTSSASQGAWTGIIVGDGGPSAITPNDTNVQFSIGNQALRVTTDAWASVSRNITPPGSSSLFTPPILIVPNTTTASQPTTFYGGDQLYRTTNPTTTPSPTWTGVAASPGGGNVSAIAASPSNPMVVYVGFEDGTIMVSSNGGASFSALTTVPFGQNFVTGISVDPTDPNTITVSASFNDTRNGIFGAPHVAQFSSAAWTVIDGNLPTNAAVSHVVYDNGALLAATDQGVYGTGAPNGGSTSWTRIGTGLPYVQTQDLFVDPTTSVVYAITHGRGAWALQMAQTTLTVTVTGSQTFGGTPTFTAAPNATLPQNVTLSGTPTCTTVNGGTPITPSLTPGGSYTIDAASCTGLSLSGSAAAGYMLQIAGGAFTVSKAPTATTVVASPTNPHLNQAVTFTATVAPNPATNGVAQPTGNVAFFVDGSSSPTATVNLAAGGTASFVDDFGGGSHNVVAVYSGDTNYLGSTSTAATATVACAQTITGAHSGVTVTAGLTCIDSANVSGAIVVNPGATLDLENSTVAGSITASSPAAVRLCGDTVGGALTVSGATGFVLVGDPAHGCAANSFASSINLTGNHGGLVVIGNSYGGTLNASGNSGSGPLPGETQPIIQDNTHS